MPSPSVLKEKQQIVAEVKEKLQNSASTIVADYRGLKVSQVTELRKQLRESGVEFRVLKNTLIRRATAETDFTDLDPFLTGPTAVAFSEEDPVVAAKILSEFAKGNEHLELKAGIVEGKVIGVDEIKELADLPSREGLLSMLLSVLQAPVRNFALAVKAVSEKQEGEAQAE